MHFMCQNDFAPSYLLSVNVTESVNTRSYIISAFFRFFLNIYFTTIVMCHVFFFFSSDPFWQFMVSEINLPQKLTNTLFVSYTSCVKLWSPLRITYTTWLSCDKLMNYKSFQKHLFCSYSLLSPCFQEVSLCCPLSIILSLVCPSPFFHLSFLSFHTPYHGVKLCHWNNEGG